MERRGVEPGRAGPRTALPFQLSFRSDFDRVRWVRPDEVWLDDAADCYTRARPGPHRWDGSAWTVTPVPLTRSCDRWFRDIGGSTWLLTGEGDLVERVAGQWVPRFIAP